MSKDCLDFYPGSPTWFHHSPLTRVTRRTRRPPPAWGLHLGGAADPGAEAKRRSWSAAAMATPRGREAQEGRVLGLARNEALPP